MKCLAIAFEIGHPELEKKKNYLGVLKHSPTFSVKINAMAIQQNYYKGIHNEGNAIAKILDDSFHNYSR